MTLTLNWQHIAKFWVPGQPKAQPRHKARAVRMGAKFRAQIYDPGTANGWKDAVGLYSLQHAPAVPIVGPVYAQITVFVPRPQYMMTAKWPEGPVPAPIKPDRDNFDKAILDALTDTKRWWRDDAQVCDGSIRKVYHGKNGKPGAMIEIAALEQEQRGLFGGST